MNFFHPAIFIFLLLLLSSLCLIQKHPLQISAVVDAKKSCIHKYHIPTQTSLPELFPFHASQLRLTTINQCSGIIDDLA